MNYNDLVLAYLITKRKVIGAGYEDDITWAEGLDLQKITEQEFLAETAWVIYNSGFRASTIRAKWPRLREAFFQFSNATTIVEHSQYCTECALQVFAHRGKAQAVASAARIVKQDGWPHIRSQLELHGPHYLKRFPFIGPVTCYHLARDLGLDCVKPDRHLSRISTTAGYDTPLAMCQIISDLTGDRLGVIDIVLWRFATIEQNYQNLFR